MSTVAATSPRITAGSSVLRTTVNVSLGSGTASVTRVTVIQLVEGKSISAFITCTKSSGAA